MKRETLQGWLLVLPAVILLAAFTHWPTLQTLWASLHTTAVPGHPSRLAPAVNLRALWADPVFWQALHNNLVYAGCTIPASLALALLMALAVNRSFPGRGLLRLAYFTPTILPMIAVANIWLYFFTPGYGLIDQALAPFGLGELNWFGNTATALPAIIVIAIWKEAGFYMIFYLAALQSLPPDLREAAALEGASRWTFFRRVVWPLLMPTTLFVFINAAIDAFRLVDQIVVITKGGPDNATTILLYYIYEVGFQVLGHQLRRPADGHAAGPAGRRRGVAVRPAGPPGALPVSVTAAAPALPLARLTTGAVGRWLEILGAWMLGVLWILPLLWAVWSAFHPASVLIAYKLFAPLTLHNFAAAWAAAPLGRYMANTVMLVSMVLVAQFVLCTPAAFAFARLRFPGRDTLFAAVLIQLMVTPDVLMVENYQTIGQLGLVDTLPGIALPYLGSAFGIFLLRQTFRTVPQDLDDAARLAGLGVLGRIWRLYVPLARPTYIAYGLVLVSFHWNNFLWPLVITNSVSVRPITVGLAIFSTNDQGIDWSIITAATLISTAPLIVAFLLFQRQFVQSFMRAGLR